MVCGAISESLQASQCRRTPPRAHLRSRARRGVSKDGPVRALRRASWWAPFDKLRAGFRGPCVRQRGAQDEGLQSARGVCAGIRKKSNMLKRAPQEIVDFSGRKSVV